MEASAVMVDEFRAPRQKTEEAVVEKGEAIFKQYIAALKDEVIESW